MTRMSVRPRGRTAAHGHAVAQVPVVVRVVRAATQTCAVERSLM
ncbi:hypothetical protein QA811_06250 [Streptomyces sp. B21-102]